MASTIKVDEILDSQGNQFDGSQLGNVGKVLQVVQGTNGNLAYFSSASGDCGASVSITPSSSSSKILVMVHLDGVTIDSTTAGYGNFFLSKNGADLIPFGYPIGWSSVDNARGTTVSTTYLDSPATTSTLTYNSKWYNRSGSVTIQINRDGAGHCLSTITAIEIGV